MGCNRTEDRIFIGVLLAIALWIVVFLPLYYGQPSSGSHPTNSPSNQSSNRESDQSHQDERWWEWVFHDATGFFTLWLVVVGGVQASLFVWNLRLIKKTLAPAEAAAKAATVAAEHIPRVERAYVFLERTLNIRVTPNPGGGEVLRVEFAFHNHGKTPAIFRRIEVDIRRVDAYPTRLRDTGASDMPPGLVLSSDETTVFFPRVTLIQPEEWMSFMRRQPLLLFLGKVEYRDIFGTMHETGFCFEWQSGGFAPSPSETLNYYT
jgi:hypothetical protein